MSLSENFEKNVKKRKFAEWKLEQTNTTKFKLVRVAGESSSSSDVFDSDKNSNLNHSTNLNETSMEEKERETSIDLIEEEESTEFKPKGKKKVTVQSQWKKNKIKLLRNSGKAYKSLSSSGKIFEARKLKEPCGDSCRLKCSTKINEELRQEIFEKYWGLKSITRQRDFINGCLQQINPTYRYTQTELGRRLNNAFHLEANCQRIRSFPKRK
ncbi:hypothetical protein ABEB36_004267 [Hypothenemus hampei]|uniref:Uncharacterized protein n=1 Tax=Hypothenemus hampei TaxID=57062 RepID=A0ABD1F295_HYPHA